MMDVDTLTVIQRERYQDFQRQADLLRLLRTQHLATRHHTAVHRQNT